MQPLCLNYLQFVQDIGKFGESNLKGCQDVNQLTWNPWQQQSKQKLGTTNSQSIHETQLKASRDVRCQLTMSLYCDETDSHSQTLLYIIQ